MKSFRVQDLTRVSIFTALMCVFAYLFLQLPVSPAPISAQTLGVMLAGLILKPGLAALSQTLYILLGALGLPVFSSGSSGIGVIIGPRGGYLWGFIIGAYITATIIERIEKYKKPAPFLAFSCASFIGGIIIVYIIGILQMSIIMRLPLKSAFLVGVLPFIPGDLLKVIVASLIAMRVRYTMY